MPSAPKTYYVIYSDRKFGTTRITSTHASNRVDAENKVRDAGFRVLYAFTKSTLKQMTRLSKEDFYVTRPKWPSHIYDLIQHLNKEDHQ